MNKTLLIINPASGKGAAQLSYVLEKCVAHFSPITILKTKRKGDAALFAKKSDAEKILIAGGDGTINEVLNGIMHKQYAKRPTIGIIPLGTSNMVARALGISTTIDKALGIIKSGKKQYVDVGKANKRYFLIGAGVGVDAAMYKNVQPIIKKMFGEIAYSVALVKTIITHKPQKLVVECKGKIISCYYALVCNIGTFSTFFEIIPNTKVNDGLLDVIVFQNKEIIDQLKYCLGLAAKRHTAFPDVKTFRTKKLIIRAKHAMVHCDAELIGKTPVKIECIPHAIRIFVP